MSDKKKEHFDILLVKSGRFLVIAIGCVLIALAILAATISLFHVYKKDTAAVLASRKAAADLVACIVQERLNKIVDVGIALADRPNFIKYAVLGNWNEASKLLENIPSLFPYIETLFLVDTDGILKGGVSSFRDIVGKSFAYRDWYKGISKEWQPYISEVYRRANEPQRNIIAVAIPIKAAHYSGAVKSLFPGKSIGNVVGILVLQIKLDVIAKWSKDFQMEKGEYLYVVDQNGHIVCHPSYLQDEIIDFKEVSTVRKLLNAQKGCEVLYDSFEKEDILTAYTPVEKYGWGVALVQPAKMAFAYRNEQLQHFLAYYGMFIVFSIIFILILLRSMNNRLRIEKELKRNRDNLEGLVKERTLKLDESNKKLQEGRDAILNILEDLQDSNSNLKIASQEWKRTFDSIQDLIFIMDTKYTIMNTNSAVTNMLNLKAEEIIGKKCYELFHKSGAPWVDCPFARTVVDKQTHSREIFDKNIGIPLLISTYPIFDDKGTLVGVIHIAKNISEQKKDEEARIDLKERLFQADKMATIGRISEGISHEINQPLCAMALTAENIITLVKEGKYDKLEESSQVILDQVEYISRIINQFRSFSRVTRESKIENVSFSKRMNNISSLLGNSLKAGNIELRLDIPIDITISGCYGTELEQVLINLINNAAYAVNSNKGEKEIVVSAEKNNGRNIIKISDNGAGIPDEYKKRMFEPFFSTKPIGEGIGLGLSFCRSIVTKYNGTITFESELGKGTTFTMSFPDEISL